MDDLFMLALGALLVVSTVGLLRLVERLMVEVKPK